jgi:HAE1 family hydrophobic/amphiphilic exporter-1
MNLPEISIRRPVMTTLVMASMLIFGFIAHKFLPVNDLPSVDYPTVSVSANLPGASPETMAASVAAPLERQFSTIAGIDSMTSSSSRGLTQITIQFDLDRNIDAAAQDVQAAIAASLKNMPAEMTTPPSYRKVNPADSPVFYLALTSAQLPLSTVDEFAQTVISQRLSTVKGVAQVQVYGSQKFAVRIGVSPDALASRGIGLDEVAKAVGQSNSSRPTGSLDGNRQTLNIQTDAQLLDAKSFGDLVVAWRGGAPVRLHEVADVISSVQNDKIASWYRDTRAIVLAIQRQPGTNTVAVVDEIRRVLPTFRAQMPASIEMVPLFDRSESIRHSVADVEFTLVLATCLVVMVIFLFLRNLSATLIPSLAMPLSVVTTFAVMHQFGYSLNNLTLMALTLAVGFVVDDAIVMLENISRHMENGEKPLEAALKGSREVGFTIISMTISLAAVFIPILFMSGVIGRLLHEFAVTICAAILISGFVSLTLTPMMAARFVRPPKDESHGALYRWFEHFFDVWRGAYEKSLAVVMIWRRTTLAIAIGSLFFAGYLFINIPKGFLPAEDSGQLFGFTEASPDISFSAMAEQQQKIAAILLADPDIGGFMSAIGAGGASSTGNAGRFFARLKPKPERKSSPEEIIERLKPKIGSIPGIRAFMQNPPVIRLSGRLSKSLYQYTLQSADLDELYSWAPKLEERLKKIPELTDVNSDLQLTSLQINVAIDRDRAAALGISPQAIEESLNFAYGARQVSTIYTATNDYQVIMGVKPSDQTEADALSLLYLRAANGKLVPLDTLVKRNPGSGPMTVNHQGQLPAVTISFNLKQGAALSDAIAKIEKAREEISMPGTVSASFQGTAQAFQDASKGLGWLLFMAILVIYIVLGILYESFIHPITILSGLPSAAVGALLALMLFKMELSVTAFVGVIMLIGIVKKNAIMMIDFAIEAQRKEGKSPDEAITEACSLRFRPIMMTTMAALMGTLPIALGLGAGAESRMPIGIAVVGGLLVSQTLTLYITPVIYVYLEQFGNWFMFRFSHPKEEKLQAAE